MSRNKQKTKYLISASQEGPWKDAGSMAKAKSMAVDRIESGITDVMFMTIDQGSGKPEMFEMKPGPVMVWTRM